MDRIKQTMFLGLSCVALSIGGCAGTADDGESGTGDVPEPIESVESAVTTAASCLSPQIPAGDVCIGIASASSGSAALYIPLDGRPVVEGPRFAVESLALGGSGGFFDGHFYLCDGTVKRVSFADGSIDVTDVPCTAATADAGGVWVKAEPKTQPFPPPPEGYDHYVDHASLLAHSPADRLVHTAGSMLPVLGRGARMISAARGGTPKTLAVEKAAGGWRTVTLRGAPVPFGILGVDVFRGHYVVATPFDDGPGFPLSVPGLMLFDATGAWVRQIVLPVSFGNRFSGVSTVVCGTAAALTRAACATPRP